MNRLSLTLSHWLALGILALGLGVICGWHFARPALIQVHPGFVPMQYNTALGFLLCGAGLLLGLHGQRMFAQACAGLLLILATLTLGQYLSAQNWGIDQWLMDHYLTTKTSHPGRMAPNTSLCFILAGITLLLLSRPDISSFRLALIRDLAALIIGLGLLALLGYGIRLEAAYGWSAYTRMAVHTACGFVLFGIAILAHRPVNAPRKTVRNQTIPWTGVAMTGLFLLSTWLWSHLSEAEDRLLHKSLEHKLSLISELMSQQLRILERELATQARLIATSDSHELSQRHSDLEALIELMPALSNIAMLTPASLQWHNPDKAVTPASIPPCQGMGDSRLRAASLEPLANPPGLLLCTRPAHSTVQLIGIIDRAALVRSNLHPSLQKDLNLSVSLPPQASLPSDPPIDSMPASIWSVTRSLPLLGSELQLQLTPRAQFVASQREVLDRSILLASILMATVLSGLIYGLQRLRETSVTLNLRERQLRSMLDVANDAVITIAEDGLIREWNPAAEKLFGWSASEMHKQPLERIIPAEHRAAHAAGLRRHLEQGDAGLIGKTVELSGLHRDGQRIPVEISLSRWQASGHRYFCGFLRDIRHRKQIERDREAAQEQLRQRSRELEQFAYLASHDLQAPLRAISGFAHMLSEDSADKLDTSAHHQIERINAGCATMRQLITDLLDYARIGSSGRQPEPVELQAIAQELQEMLKPSLTACGGELLFDELPQVYGDRSQLKCLLQNLLENAHQYRSERALKILISARREDGQWIITVADNGIGIDARHHQRIFQIFRRLDSASDAPGSGIGLAICQRIVGRHGGKLWIESEPGQGASFHFSLPDLQDLLM